MLEEAKLEQLAQLALKATAGPWTTDDYGVHAASHRPVAFYPPCGNAREELVQAWANGDYIAALSPDVLLELVAEIRAARGIA